MTSAAASHHDDLGDQLHNPAFLQDLRQQMIKFAFLQLSSLPQAEDVVQEALTSAFQHLDSFKGRAAFKTWVFSILKNKIIDVLRQKSRLVAMSELFKDEESELSVDELFDASG
ncbi:sigma-70 family RNA polymerase sigma factor, partial [Acinetobacter nosocomialis]